MAPRKSSRLQDLPDQNPSDAVRDVPSQAERGTKRKATTGQDVAKDVGIPKRAKKHTTEVAERATVSKAQGLSMQGLDKLSALPPDCFDMVADNITDHASISALSRTSRGLYTLMAPRLYNRVAVAAMFHAHIPKLIRTLEPHLTIKQKKQLKKEGKYRGQQEKYPTGLDEEKVPVCAGYVRQLVIGISDPGKKHKYIVNRYLEEALKNMENVDIVQTNVVNKSVCEGIASLAGLKALSTRAYRTASDDDMAPLARIKNLKHLDIVIKYDGLATCQSLLRNSMSTLQSLEISMHSVIPHCFADWKKYSKSGGHDTTSDVDKRPDFPALRSLSIAGMMIDDEFVEEFARTIKFSNLRELALERLRGDQNHFWHSLPTLIASYKSSNTTLSLRTLFIDLGDTERYVALEQQSAEFAAKCSFIASFDTLTTLKLPNYGHYRSNEGFQNPGLSDVLLRAIVKHKNLRVLQISYVGKTSGLEIPYLGAKAIGDIIDALHHLQEFEFAPDELQMDEISQALCRGKTLESVICSPHESWQTYPRSDPLGMNILSSVLSTFMSNAEVDAGHPKFVWEEHYKLNRLDLKHTKWDIGSKFGKREKGYGKPKKVQVQVRDDTREVWHQSVPFDQYLHVGYDVMFDWVTKVQKEIE